MGIRLFRWSQMHETLEARFATRAEALGHRAAPENAVVALRDSPLWEIRADSVVPVSLGSSVRSWLEEEDPEFGLSVEAFSLLRDEGVRALFVSQLRALIDDSTPTPTSSLAPNVSNADEDWDIEVGEVLRRAEVHDRYGGSRQSGISHSRQTSNILLFADPAAREKHGYFDGWSDDGLFHYTGTGQKIDQIMPGDNERLLQHRKSKRPLRLFRVLARAKVQYAGRFCVDEVEPWYPSRAPATADGPERSVIVFRLRPDGEVEDAETAAAYGVATSSRVVSIPLEKVKTESYTMSGAPASVVVRRKEGKLVEQYAAYLRSLGHDVSRNSILPVGESGSLQTDLYDETTGDLVEAKSDVHRNSIRLAIGQLLDYRRFIDPSPRLNVLLPARPRRDLLDLCATVNVTVIWKSDALPGWDHS